MQGDAQAQGVDIFPPHGNISGGDGVILTLQGCQSSGVDVAGCQIIGCFLQSGQNLLVQGNVIIIDRLAFGIFVVTRLRQCAGTREGHITKQGQHFMQLGINNGTRQVDKHLIDGFFLF